MKDSWLLLMIMSPLACSGRDGRVDVRDPSDAAGAGKATATTLPSVGRTGSRQARRTEREAERDAKRVGTERFLWHRAERLHFDDAWRVRRAVHQEAARETLKRHVEREVTPSAVDEAEVARRYEEQRARFVHPELRESVHLLVQTSGSGSQIARQAAAIAQEALQQLLRNPDAPLLTFQAFTTRSAGPQLVLRVERVPPLARDAQADPAYLRALFDAAAPGPVPRVVRSQFGWHAIALTHVLPAQALSVREAEPDIRRELATEQRSEETQQLLKMLRRRHPVQRSPAALNLILQMKIEA